MDFSNGSVSNDRRKVHKSAFDSADRLSVSLLKTSPKSPMSPKSPRSPKVQGKHSPFKHDRSSHSPKDGRPKKSKMNPFVILFPDQCVNFLLA